MSNQSKKSKYDIIIDFTEREINKLRDEIVYLLENPITEEKIEGLEQRLNELEKMLYNVV